MRNIKLTLEYDGTLFNGWQVQDKKCRTVQGELEKACAKIFKEKPRVFGSGRTDSRVHAVGQVANFHAETTMPCREILRALNAHLPEDIAIVKVQDVDEKFHAQFSAKWKTYRYTILNRQARCAQLRHFCLFHPYKLNLKKMRKEAKNLIGRKDFQSFQATDTAGSKRSQDTVRTVRKLTLIKKKDFIVIEIEANGFLYKMVRNIVGTLLDVGTGRLEEGSIKKILTKRDRSFASATAAAHGLCLINVKYS